MDIVSNICKAIVKRGTHIDKHPKVGRPRVNPENRKADPIRSIRVPDDEWETIKQAAARRGQSASELIRSAALAAANTDGR